MRQLKTVSEMIQEQCKKQVELQTTNLPRPRSEFEDAVKTLPRTALSPAQDQSDSHSGIL